MSHLIKVVSSGFKPYSQYKVLPANFTYCWANTVCVLGVGRSSGAQDNDRVNPVLDQKKIKSIKDAGKSLCAYFVQCESKQPMCLYVKEDVSEMLSKNQSKLEAQTKKELSGEAFMKYNDLLYSKVSFMDDVVYPKVLTHFGTDSLEEVLTKIAAGDGDLWSRFKRHDRGKIALDNVLNFIESL